MNIPERAFALLTAVWLWDAVKEHGMDLHQANAEIQALYERGHLSMRESGPWVELLLDARVIFRVDAELLSLALLTDDPLSEVLAGRVD